MGNPNWLDNLLKDVLAQKTLPRPTFSHELLIEACSGNFEFVNGHFMKDGIEATLQDKRDNQTYRVTINII